jgi:hypothetical protein
LVVAIDTAGAAATAVEVITAMMVAAHDVMAAVENEEAEVVTIAIGAAEATQDMAATEGVVAMATAVAMAAATTSRHTIFKARRLSIFFNVIWRRYSRWII